MAGEIERATKEQMEKIGKMLESVTSEAAKEAQMVVRGFKKKGREMVKRVEQLKKEAEEEHKTEAEEEELERRMGELEEEMERIEEMKRRVREEDWSEEYGAIQELVMEKVRGWRD